MEKTACKGLTIVLMLILSISMPYLAATNKTPSTQTQHPPQAIIVTQHTITASELEALKSGRGTYQTNQNYNQIVDGHGTGLSPSNYESAIAQNTQVIDTIQYYSTPPTIDNSATPWFPPIGNQDGQGSCAAWAVGYYVKTYQEAKEHAWDLSDATWDGGYYGHPSISYQNKIMSPSFLYNLINYGVDGGSNFEEAIELINNVGLCSWQNMPYAPAEASSWPSESAWTEAALYRGNSSYGYKYLYANTDQGISNLKNWLAAGNLAVIAVDANQYDYLSSADFWTTDNYATVELNHANTIVGYDDNVTYTEAGVTHSGAFKLANSWGLGSWEHVADGFLWVSYNAIKQLCTISNPTVTLEDLSGYQPQVLTSFRINHSVRGDCQITFGLGTANAPIVTKNFHNYVLGGSFPFCSNNIVLDLTEFKDYMTAFYNQPFFMSVFDRRYNGGTATTGNITYFAIGNTSSTQTPMATINNAYVNLALICSIYQPTLDLSPTAGPAGGIITLNGAGFIAGSSLDISYFNPVNSIWNPVVSDYAISEDNFTYNIAAPDLQQNNIAGDNAALSDAIVFQVKDNTNGYTINATVPYMEYRRGLTQIATGSAVGLYGNNTDLSSSVFVQSLQMLTVNGRWFNPGEITLLWDGVTELGTSTANEAGTFTASIQVPSEPVGKHTITIRDSTNFCVNITKIPTITDNSTADWQTQETTITLIPDTPVNEIYYKINDYPTQSISVNGQPKISSEGPSNTLEYWGTWDSEEIGNIELPHTRIVIKIDATAPNGTISAPAITSSSTVPLSLLSTDVTSGVVQMRFSNDGITFSEWEPYANTKLWTLTGGDGQKTVHVQYRDDAGLVSCTCSCSVTLNSSQPTQTTTPTATPLITQPTTTPTQNPVPSPTPTLSPIPSSITLPSATTPISEASLMPQALMVVAVLAVIAIVAVGVALVKKKNK